MTYRDRVLHLEQAPLAEIAARAGTPAYVYSSAGIEQNFRAYDAAFGSAPHSICYSVKANGNLSILRLLARAGSGFDIVSGGELYRVMKAGGDPARVVFSGVGKTAAEIDQALEAGIFVFNAESEPELALIDALAQRRGRKARVALRINPDVDAATHAYISTGRLAHKFGVDIGEAEAVYLRARELKNLSFEGVSCHIGSQLLDSAPLLSALDRLMLLIDRLRAHGFEIRHADLGGGVGIAYKPEDAAPDIAGFVKQVRERAAVRGLHILIEPGRSIAGNAGVLLTRVLYRKKTGDKEFVVVDAAMNDLIRPALYGAYHHILPVRQTEAPPLRADVVGPVCETGDFLARDREIPQVLPGDVLAILSAGAYGFAQSSNYNSRPRAAEILVEGSQWRIIRRRESYEDLIRGEE
ncbi:MAG TPA: diaminopimelate decarboxylase [Bryobacteraceae bacterium]|jgi:diaminopimelate decarboxylase|nr:diaminopimelate decarboxylase [Bryobacteraceae bacterium]